MPRLNGSGPLGEGPGTGRRMGNCFASEAGLRRGFGRGLGYCNRQRFISPKNELSALEEEEKSLKEELEIIQEEIKTLKDQK